jgi:peptide/nickel transport system substrate-binding protein
MSTVSTVRPLLPTVVAALLAAALGLPASAQTLRWATQGDPQTMDPHAQNESLTNQMNAQVYETLVGRDKQLGIVPQLATEWQQTGPLVWRFKLRPNVKFHDGSAFTADDVVFSILRAREPSSNLIAYANQVGEPKKIDPLTVEFRLAEPNPVFLQHMNTLFILSKSWSEKNRVAKPQDFKNKEESFAAMNANGTGPFILVSRQPDIKTTYKRNPAWWGKFEGNLQEVVYTPIKSDATRLAALVSGEVDFVLDPAPRDVARLKSTAGIKVVEGVENRVLFIGMDQSRDKLLYGQVPGDTNPFKDVRVRRALYQAIDIEAIKTKLMNGQAIPTCRSIWPLPARGWRMRATPMASRSAWTARTTATSTTRRSASRWRACGRSSRSRCGSTRCRAPCTSPSCRSSTPASTCSAGAARSPTRKPPSPRSTAAAPTRAWATGTSAT